MIPFFYDLGLVIFLKPLYNIEISYSHIAGYLRKALKAIRSRRSHDKEFCLRDYGSLTVLLN